MAAYHSKTSHYFARGMDSSWPLIEKTFLTNTTTHDPLVLKGYDCTREKLWASVHRKFSMQATPKIEK